MAKTLFIYIIGAQCTGKTTLVNAVTQHIRKEEPNHSFTIIKELARGILETANVNRDDIRAGSEKAMNFQRLLLEKQREEELNLQTYGFIISDRSGIDPIAYATLYGPSENAKALLETPSWALLRERMRQSTVILCEPVQDWLSDDGVRLMPEDNKEWFGLHGVFVDPLQQTGVKFEVLPATCISTEQRVAFVLKRWREEADASFIRPRTADAGLAWSTSS